MKKQTRKIFQKSFKTVLFFSEKTFNLDNSQIFNFAKLKGSYFVKICRRLSKW